jgi:hypothetical protein
VKISAFDFAGANGFNQNAPTKDQEIAAGSVPGASGGGPLKPRQFMQKSAPD